LWLVIAGLREFCSRIPTSGSESGSGVLVVLPPLLYNGAWKLSWRDFGENFCEHFMLAVGLVRLPRLVWRLPAPWVFKGFDWRLGLVLGAVLSTTDAIAATALRRLGLAKRIVDILEGESLCERCDGLWWHWRSQWRVS